MQVRIEVQGHTPLILNRFGEDAEASVSSGTSISYKGDKGTPLEIATKKLYVGRNGVLMIPNPNMLSCITQAGTFFKTGKRQLTTQKSSLIPACVEIEEIEIPLVHKEPWTVDTRLARRHEVVRGRHVRVRRDYILSGGRRAMRAFKNGQRVRITYPDHPLRGMLGTVKRLRLADSCAWVSMDEDLPEDMRSFPVDDPSGRGRHLLLEPVMCEAA